MSNGTKQTPSLLQHLLGRSVFPSSFAWFLEGPWRRWILSPAALARRLPLTPATTLCEIGVGGGYYARALSGAAHRVVGLDIQSAMLRRVRLKATAANLVLVQGDATALPLASRSVDVIVAVTVLGEVGSADAAIAEIARVLRPGGLLSISEHFPDPDFQSFAGVVRLCRRQRLALEDRFGPPWAYTANFRASAS